MEGMGGFLANRRPLLLLGHEMVHGFDNNGKAYDKDGFKFNWWTQNEESDYDNRTKCMAEQYNSFAIEHNNKIYTISERCEEPQQGYFSAGSNVPGYQGVSSTGPDDCAKKCTNVTDCVVWTFRKSSSQCWLKTINAGTTFDNDYVSGCTGCIPSVQEIATLGENVHIRIQLHL